MESDYSYLKEQERTWDSLGFNKFMVRTTVDADNNALSGDDFNAMMQGASINASRVVSISAGQLLNGVVNAVIDIGNGATGTYLRLDGVNNRFLINDGSNDLVLFGFQKGGF